MKTDLKKPCKQLPCAIMVSGLICNLIVGAVGLSINDNILVCFCSLLAIISIISIILSHRGFESIGVHLMVLVYLEVFILASFTHIASYALLLVYPILIGFVSLYFKQPRVQNIYTVLAIVGCGVTILNTHILLWNELNIIHLIGSLVIAVGLLTGFILTIKAHSRKLANYREQRNEIEQAITEKNTALREYIKTNLQLENFAHLASHELKTPIKNVSNFSQLLEKRIKNKLEAKDLEILSIIIEESQRMSGMMADLLKLSQLASKKIDYQKINGHKFINSLVEDNFTIDKGFIAVNSFPLELIVAEAHLQILFFNIIQNAIKFCGAHAEPKITIYGRRSQEYYYFEIKDNGIGIDDKYKESVFLIFNKLNPSVNLDGTGIGLSMCREIVERHQGRIWIEDNVEGGTVVKFTLKRNKLIREPQDSTVKERHFAIEARTA